MFGGQAVDTAELKKLDRRMKREFSKHKQSEKWTRLSGEFKAKFLIEKQRYFDNIKPWEMVQQS